MNCPKCGAIVSDNDCFCEECGKRLKITSEQPKISDNIVLNSNSPSDHQEIFFDKSLALVSDIGLKHTSNQDSGNVIRCDNGNVIMIVADGVSSSLKATNASKTAVNVTSTILKSYDNNSDVTEVMENAIRGAHKDIISLPYKSQNENIDDPETTIVAAIKIGSNLTVGWVGDSRAYLITDGVEEKLTIDDSWIEETIKEGKLTREQASLDKRSHYITQVLGMTDDSINIHIINKEISSGSIVLLCSDGLWNYLPKDGDISNLLNSFDTKLDALSICNKMVSYANEHGGHDNITIALLLV